MIKDEWGLPAITFGLLGRKLGHSWSPKIHAALGSTPYSLVELEPNQVEDFIRNGSWRGINVTIPYKRMAAELADEQSPAVRRLGVANTLVRRKDGSVYADNTDVTGFTTMVAMFAREHFGCSSAAAFAGRKALVLGSGGASQAVKDALRESVAADVSVISRKGNNTYETLLERHSDAVLVVNTTPVGMFPDCPQSPLAPEVLPALPQLKAVLDVIYNPSRTRLCLDAERLVVPYASGLTMLVAQALYASELFQDKELDDSLIVDIERSIRNQTSNISLIGMPGCGKTGAGRRLAHLTKRPFVDIDDAITLEIGRPIPEFFAEHGEAAFREVETRVLADVSKRSGLVIACGGGVVTRQENYELLHQNGNIVFLDRPLDELATEGRPLSQSKGVSKLASERMHLYHAWADTTLPCTGTAAGDARAIAEMFGLL